MLNARRSSPIWQLDRESLCALIARSESSSDVLRHFGLNPEGGNCLTLKTRLIEDGIDFSHIGQGRNSTKGRRVGGCETALADILVRDSAYTNRRTLKRRLIKAGLLVELCAICGQHPVWNNQRLMLVLDHINGKNNDNRLENLRLLCPNCNSQTETFCGRNLRRITEEY